MSWILGLKATHPCNPNCRPGSYRHRCEANNTTNTRLQLILKNVFPPGARHVTPRDQPSAYFVRILCFIAEVQLKLAMTTIEELLGAAAIKTTNPDRVQICAERQNIGLRAFVAIANSLGQRWLEYFYPENYQFASFLIFITFRSENEITSIHRIFQTFT